MSMAKKTLILGTGNYLPVDKGMPCYAIFS